jgi:hypothetical protein
MALPWLVLPLLALPLMELVLPERMPVARAPEQPEWSRFASWGSLSFRLQKSIEEHSLILGDCILIR